METKTYFTIGKRKIIILANLVLSFYIFNFFNSCNLSDSGNVQSSSFKKKRGVIVFVDITNSLLKNVPSPKFRRLKLQEFEKYRQERFERIHEDAEKIIKSLPFSSRIRICAIHARTNMSIPLVNKAFGSRRHAQEKRDFAAAKDSVLREFSLEFESIRNVHGSDLLNSTCIKESISQIGEFRKDLNLERFQLDVIYLSDMEETCEIRKSSSDSSDVLKNIKIYVIPPLTKTGDAPAKYLQIENIEIDWKPFFVAMGAHPDSVEIGRQLPFKYEKRFKVFRNE